MAPTVSNIKLLRPTSDVTAFNHGLVQTNRDHYNLILSIPDCKKSCSGSSPTAIQGVAFSEKLTN